VQGWRDAVDLLATRLAYDPGYESLSADMRGGWRGSALPPRIPVPPVLQREYHRVEVASGVGQNVFVPGGVLAVLNSFQNPRGNEAT
jgi:hypothetical protein